MGVKTLIIAAAALIGAAMVVPVSAEAQQLAQYQRRGDDCNCTPRRVYRPAPRPQSDTVCIRISMLPADWAACQTKTWRLSTPGDRVWTKQYDRPTITICRPRTHPNFGYVGKGTGRHYVVDFAEGRARWAR